MFCDKRQLYKISVATFKNHHIVYLANSKDELVLDFTHLNHIIFAHSSIPTYFPLKSKFYKYIILNNI
ncbi:hypothetical protein A7M46_17800 [Acinetobacter baumannii]|nr:hypothetical protein A7M46_17800 [Acinetobacter baumannii]